MGVGKGGREGTWMCEEIGKGSLLRGEERGKEEEGPGMGWLSPCCRVLAGNSKESKKSTFKPGLPGIFVKEGGQNIFYLITC